jgi:hypothetical protein
VKRAASIALVVAAIVVPSSSAIESTLVPGVGIGKVRLGMTLAQVKHVLGPPATTNIRAQLPDRRGYIEYGWNFSTLWVGFVNTKGVLHAVLVGTDLRSEGQFKGVGIGTVRDKLRSALPVVACAPRNWQQRAGVYYRVRDTNKAFVDYCLFGPSGRVTAFDIWTDVGKDCHPAWTYENCRWYVKSVLVTGAF